MAAATVTTVVGAGNYIRKISGGDYTMTRDDVLVEVDASGAASVVTLPDPATCAGIPFFIIRTVGILNSVSVAGTGGPFTVALPLLSGGIFVSNGVTWRRFGTI